MYRIRGPEGQEEGPLSAAEIRGLLSAGRITPDTPARAEADTVWKTLSSFPELQAAPPPVPPSLPAPPAPVRPPPPPLPESRLSGLAVASVVFGALGVLIFPGLVGLVCGLMAESRISRSRGRLRGHGVAVLGIGLSCVMMLLPVVLVATVVFQNVRQGMMRPGGGGPRFAQPPVPVDPAMVLAQLGKSLRQYANDHADLLPATTNWCESVREYAPSPSVFLAPGTPVEQRSSWALNAAVAGRNVEELPPGTVLLFSSGAGWNAAGGTELAGPAPGAGGMILVLLADGTVRRDSRAGLVAQRWTP